MNVKTGPKTRGGGLLLYINNTFQYKRRFDFETENIESVWIELKLPKSKPIYICSVYRSPGSLIEWIDNFEKEIEAVLGNDDKEVLIMGDLNFNLLQNPPKRWLDFIEMFNLTQNISQPTRITENSSTLIDHIYTNRPENISEVIVSSFSASDHFPVCATRNVHTNLNHKNSHTLINYRDFKKFDEDKFLNCLMNSNLSNVENIVDVDEAMNSWNEIVITTLNNCAPMKTKRVKSNLLPNWLNSEITEARKKRDNYHKKKDFNQYKR